VVVVAPLSGACGAARATTGFITAEKVTTVRQDLKNIERILVYK
jgi:hypothetical protein